MNIFDLSAKLSLDTDGFKKGLSGAALAAQGFGSTMSKGLKTAITLGTEAVAAATTAVVAFGKSALDASVQYESAFAQVQTIMDTSQMSVEDMSSAIKELSSEMGVSTEELSNTVYNAISATGDTANAVALAGQASMLATAGFTDTASALSVLTTAMNAYGMSADEAEDISNSLIMVQNLGVTTVSELSSSMGKAIASASAYGVNLSNLESAYVSITKAGISTAEGTTYISSMLKELGDSGSDVSGILQEKTGKSFDQLMAEGKTLGDVLGILNEAVDGDSTALMNLWSSAEAGKASSAIVGQGLEAFNENLKAIEDSSEATQKAYDIMANTFEHKTEVIGTSWTNFMASMGDGLNDFASESGGILDLAIGWVSMLQQGLEENGIQGVIDAFSTILKEAIKFISSKLPTLLKTGVDLLMAVIDGILEALPELIDAVLEVGTIILDSIVEYLPKILDAIVEVMTAVIDKLTEPDVITKLIESAILIMETLANGLLESLPQLLDAAAQVLFAILDGIIESLPEVIDATLQVITAIVDKLTEPDTMNKLIESAILIVGALIEGIAKATPVLLESALQMLVAFIGAIIMNLPKIGELAVQIMDTLTFGLYSKFVEIRKKGEEALLKLIEGISNKVASLKTKINNIATDVINWFKTIPTKIVSVGSDIISGLWNGINSKVDWIKGKILGFSDSVLSTIKGFFGIASPSKVFKEVGGFMAEGLGIGWDNEYDAVRKQIEDGLSMDLSTNIKSSSQGTAMNEELELMREQNQLLQQLLQKEFGIAGSDIFRSVRESAKTFEKSTGLKAFA